MVSAKIREWMETTPIVGEMEVERVESRRLKLIVV